MAEEERERLAEKQRIAELQAKMPPPEILGVTPVLSSLQGSRLLVQGDNFAIGISVEIGGRPVPASDVELIDVHHLLVRKTPVR